MSDETWDLIVVGGGPAGSAAALAAVNARPGARVLLLDRADFPRDKACGDGIAAHGRDELAKLGVGDLIADYTPSTRLSVVSPGGATVSATAARPNHVVPRKVFDARLVDAARARGVEVRRHRVKELSYVRDTVVVDGLVARAVVAADGANSTVRRLLHVPAVRPKHVALAVRGYADLPADSPRSDGAQFIAMQKAGWPAYAWSFPIGDGTANVGFGMLLPHLQETGRPGKEVLHGRLAALLPDLPARELIAHHLPLSPGRPGVPGRGRVLLAGDAASLVNPLTGEGIYYALVSGRLAGEAAVTAADPMRAYRPALRAALGNHLRTTDVLARAAQSSRFVDAAIATASRRTDVFNLLVDVGLGAGTVPLPLAWSVVKAWARGGR